MGHISLTGRSCTAAARGKHFLGIQTEAILRMSGSSHEIANMQPANLITRC